MEIINFVIFTYTVMHTYVQGMTDLLDYYTLYMHINTFQVQQDKTDTLDSVCTCRWYILVYSRGFPHSSIVQWDGTDTLDSVRTCR